MTSSSASSALLNWVRIRINHINTVSIYQVAAPAPTNPRLSLSPVTGRNLLPMALALALALTLAVPARSAAWDAEGTRSSSHSVAAWRVRAVLGRPSATPRHCTPALHPSATPWHYALQLALSGCLAGTRRPEPASPVSGWSPAAHPGR